MLVDYEYKNGNLICSFIDSTGNIKLKYYPWSPTKFIATSLDDTEKHGRFITWDGRPVKEIYTKYPNKYQLSNQIYILHYSLFLFGVIRFFYFFMFFILKFFE